MKLKFLSLVAVFTIIFPIFSYAHIDHYFVLESELLSVKLLSLKTSGHLYATEMRPTVFVLRGHNFLSGSAIAEIGRSQAEKCTVNIAVRGEDVDISTPDCQEKLSFEHAMPRKYFIFHRTFH